MPKKLTIEQELVKFLDVWNMDRLFGFLRDIIPMFELYDVEDEGDWIEKEVGSDIEALRNVRLLRMAYLISRIAENHAGALCRITCEFKNLWKRMEEEAGYSETSNS